MPEIACVSDQMYCLQYSDPFAGDLFMTTNNLPYYSLENDLNNLLWDSQLNYEHCLLIVDCDTVDFWGRLYEAWIAYPADKS